MSGESNLIIEAREALIDAVEALGTQAKSLILVGAQAIYLHTDRLELVVAPATKDSDFVIDSRSLEDKPILEERLSAAGFMRDPISSNPGAWINVKGIPVDFMVPAKLVSAKTRRSVNLNPHADYVARKTLGIEAALLDNEVREIKSFSSISSRSCRVAVAGPASLLVAKLIKVGERIDQSRISSDKDSYDILRIFEAVESTTLVSKFVEFSENELTEVVVVKALEVLTLHFASSQEAYGPVSAGRVEYGIGNPDEISARLWAYSVQFLQILERNSSATSGVTLD
jgi:hypothetical protein